MNSHQSTARQNMDVMTFVVIVMVVAAVLGVATYFMINDVIPFVNHLQTQLSSTQPIHQK